MTAAKRPEIESGLKHERNIIDNQRAIFSHRQGFFPLSGGDGVGFLGEDLAGPHLAMAHWCVCGRRGASHIRLFPVLSESPTAAAALSALTNVLRL